MKYKIKYSLENQKAGAGAGAGAGDDALRRPGPRDDSLVRTPSNVYAANAYAQVSKERGPILEEVAIKKGWTQERRKGNNSNIFGIIKNENKIKSIEYEITNNSVPHFNKNNADMPYRIEKLLQRGTDVTSDTDSTPNLNIHNKISLNKLNQLSNPTGADIYKKTEKITKDIIDITIDYQNNNSQDELHKTMFLFGIPTFNIIELLRRINNIRVLELDGEDITDETLFPHEAMSGFVELSTKDEENNIIIVSISEGTFNEKKIERSNSFIKFLTEKLGDDYNLEIELPSEKMVKSNLYVEYIDHFYEKYITDFNTEYGLPEKMPTITNNNLSLNGYSNDTTIRFIFSHQYNAERYKELESFIPAKKGGKCNNGSICVEPINFTYICDNYSTNYPSKFIKGGVAYWFNKTIPKIKTCAAGKYCFEDFGEVHTRIQNNYVRVIMARIINEDLKKDLIDIIQTSESGDPSKIKDPVYDRILQGFAVPCPGCQINYYNFLLNNRDYWNNSFCTDIVKEEELSLTEDEYLQKNSQRNAAALKASAEP